MYGSYYSRQGIEVVGQTDSHTARFQIVLTCVSPGCAAQTYGPPENCYPAEAAEFELASIHLIDSAGNLHDISEELFKAIVGKLQAGLMIENAYDEAEESGDF
jgi:hypothetical protein